MAAKPPPLFLRPTRNFQNALHAFSAARRCASSFLQRRRTAPTGFAPPLSGKKAASTCWQGVTCCQRCPRTTRCTAACVCTRMCLDVRARRAHCICAATPPPRAHIIMSPSKPAHIDSHAFTIAWARARLTAFGFDGVRAEAAALLAHVRTCTRALTRDSGR